LVVWDRIDLGRLLENFVINEINEMNPTYFRTLSGAEIDVIVGDPPIPIEIKGRGKPRKAFYNFIRDFNSPFGIVFWMKKTEISRNVYFIPVWEV